MGMCSSYVAEPNADNGLFNPELDDYISTIDNINKITPKMLLKEWGGNLDSIEFVYKFSITSGMAQ